MSNTQRYICSLSPELEKQAHEELNEPLANEDRWKAIDELKAAFSEEKYGKLISNDDTFFLRFLRAKKFNQTKALKCLQNYHKIRQDLKSVFDKVANPVLLKPILQKVVLYILPGKARDGSSVMLYRPGLLDKDVNIYDILAYSILSIEKILEDESVQVCGLRSLEDMDNFNLSIIFKISVTDLAKMNSVWMDAMPLRFKAAHLVHEGRVYDAIINLMKPFLKKKMLDRINAHGSDYASIHKFIDPMYIPPYLGGSGLDPEEGGRQWNEKLSEDWTQDTAL